MNNINSTSFVLSRSYWLGVYAKIIARLRKTSGWVQHDNIADKIQTNSINPYEIAYLQEKETGVIKLVCFELMQMGFIQVRDNRLEIMTYFNNTSHLEAIEQSIFDFLHTPQTIEALLKDKNLQSKVAECCQTYRQSLVTLGYVRANEKLVAAGMSSIFFLGLIFCRPIVGMLAGYRYLLLLVGAAMPKVSLAIAATAWLGRKAKSSSHLTTKGKEYLAELKKNHTESLELSSPPIEPNSNTSLFFALHGFMALSKIEIEAYKNMFGLLSTG